MREIEREIVWYGCMARLEMIRYFSRRFNMCFLFDLCVSGVGCGTHHVGDDSIFLETIQH